MSVVNLFTNPDISEMVKRVARAMCEEPDALVCRDQPGRRWLASYGVSYAPRPEDIFPAWMLRVQDARAAIEAMRKPTSEMWNKAMPYMDSYSSNGAWWQVMIDAALKE